MNQEIEISFWHFPDDPEINYNGTLSIIDGSIELILIECPDTPKGTFTLYGFTQKGERITLLDCLCVGRHMSTPGFFKCEIDARYAILGGFIDPSFCKFENAIVKLANIDNWLEKSGFSEYQSTEDTVSLKFSIPDKIDLYIDSDREYAFIFRKKAPLFTPLNEVFLYQEAFLRMQHNSPFTLEFFWEEVTLISSFLTIAYFDQPQILSITFGYKGSQMECKYRGQRKAEYKAKKHKVNFLFTYPMISSNLQDIFKNWKQLGEIANPVIYALHEGFSERQTLVEDKFLNIMHAIETFHRRTRKNVNRPKEIHKQIILSILDNCPNEHKSWLKEKLNYSNEPSLKERLTSLFNEISPIFIHRFFPDYETIINDSRNSRNYYTHYDSGLEKKALKRLELSTLAQRLRIFLLVILLSEIKIPEDQLKKILIDGSNFHFNHLIKNKTHQPSI